MIVVIVIVIVVVIVVVVVVDIDIVVIGVLAQLAHAGCVPLSAVSSTAHFSMPGAGCGQTKEGMAPRAEASRNGARLTNQQLAIQMPVKTYRSSSSVESKIQTMTRMPMNQNIIMWTRG